MANGLFSSATEACEAAVAAQKELVTKYTFEDRDRFIQAIRNKAMENMQTLAQMEFDETGYGRIEDKAAKNTGAVTPVTNPAATIFGNGIANVAAGNAVVFNTHPGAKETSAFTVKLVNEAITGAGGPENLFVCLENPTMETLDEIMNHPAVRLLVGTGGPGMVKTLMGSGKKVIAAGAGNPPCIIDETADLSKAAAGLLGSASFDNNLLCIAEKEVFAVDTVFDQLVAELKKLGVVQLSTADGQKLRDQILVPDPKGVYSKFAPNKKYVGKYANVILRGCGFQCDTDPRIAIYETDFTPPSCLI